NVTAAGRPGGARPAKVRQLSTSFRNTGRVLDAAAALQQGLRDEVPQVPRLVPPPRRAGRGRVVCALLETAADEAAWAASQIEGLLDLPPGTAPDGEPWPDHGSARIRPADIAVLCRKRSQFPVLRAAIEARGIPVAVVGLGGLLPVPDPAAPEPAAPEPAAPEPAAPEPAAPEPAAPEGAVPERTGRGNAAPDGAGQGPATATAGPAGPAGEQAGAAGRPRGNVKHD